MTPSIRGKGLKADLLLHDACVYPDARTSQQLSAIAIQGSRVIGLGTKQELDHLIGPDTQVESIGGRVILPGLVDAHIHLAGYANALAQVDCQTKTLEHCLSKIDQLATRLEPGQWIQGHGWDQNIWGEWPTAAKLDRVAPHNPVYLTARSLHAASANSAALQQAHLTSKSPDPSDGYLQRTDSGALTGILFEGAMRLVSDQIPAPSISELSTRLIRAQENLWRFGLVGVHDFDGASCFAALQILNEQKRLGLRVLKSVRSEYLESAIRLGLRPAFGDEWLRIGNVKLFSDGALGPRTAAMVEPYDDDPNNLGVQLLEEEEITAIGYQAARAGFSLAVHAIGDKANQDTLNSLARLHAASMAESARLPYRMEHLQLMRSPDIARPAQLAVIASMQPVHAISDMEMAKRAWGSRCERSYAWKSILDSGATLAFGSDAPVEEPNPFWGIHAAVTRSKRESPTAQAFTPEQRISLGQALTAYTVGPHQAAGNVFGGGTLAVGEKADLIVVKENPFEIRPADLVGLRPEAVCVNGEWRLREF